MKKDKLLEKISRIICEAYPPRSPRCGTGVGLFPCDLQCKAANVAREIISTMKGAEQ